MQFKLKLKRGGKVFNLTVTAEDFEASGMEVREKFFPRSTGV